MYLNSSASTKGGYVGSRKWSLWFQFWVIRLNINKNKSNLISVDRSTRSTTGHTERRSWQLPPAKWKHSAATGARWKPYRITPWCDWRFDNVLEIYYIFFKADIIDLPASNPHIYSTHPGSFMLLHQWISLLSSHHYLLQDRITNI